MSKVIDLLVSVQASDTRIEKEFANSPDKSLATRSVKRAKNIIGDDVTISSTDEEGWSIIFDQIPTKVGVSIIAYNIYSKSMIAYIFIHSSHAQLCLTQSP